MSGKNAFDRAGCCTGPGTAAVFAIALVDVIEDEEDDADIGGGDDDDDVVVDALTLISAEYQRENCQQMT
jgi:hypothetical protein